MIKEKDSLRKKIEKARGEEEKSKIQAEYKRMRNVVTNNVRKDTIEYNEDRIEKAGDENKVWKVVNDITKPKTERGWELEEDGKEIKNEEEIADVGHIQPVLRG